MAEHNVGSGGSKEAAGDNRTPKRIWHPFDKNILLDDAYKRLNKDWMTLSKPAAKCFQEGHDAFQKFAILRYLETFLKFSRFFD